MKFSLLSLCLILTVNLSFSQISPSKKTKIDKIVTGYMSEYGVPGFSLAITEKGAVSHRKEFGLANLEHNVPTSDSSIYRVYSLTKLFIATALLNLEEDGKLSLEDEIKKYNLGIPSSWEDRTIHDLLSHSSGFPDMAPIPEYQNLSEEEARNKVMSQDLLFEKGTSYRYNQSNFYLIQKIIEKVSGQSLVDYIAETQFDGDKTEAFFSTDSRDIVKNRVTPYFPFTTGKFQIDHPYLQGDYFQACNGMNITMDNYIAWDLSLRRNELISKESKQRMLETYSYTESNKQFTAGWDKRVLNLHPSYGFTGSLVTAYRIFPEDDFSIILLGNGLAEIFDIENLVNDIAHAINDDIIDLERKLVDQMLEMFSAGNTSGCIALFEGALEKPAYKNLDLEGIANSVGYHMMNSKKTEDAILLFEANVAAFPKSWNVYDSLGEAYMAAGNKEKSIANYKKSLEINPNNAYGKAALEKLGKG